MYLNMEAIHMCEALNEYFESAIRNVDSIIKLRYQP